MRKAEFPKVISAKVTSSQYEICKRIAGELYKERIIEKPTVSEVLRLFISQIEQKVGRT